MTPLGRQVAMLLSNKKSKLVACSSTLDQQFTGIDEVISNEYLLTEILLRVPPKPLITLRCVSKHWLSIISDASFCSNHASRNAKTSIVSGLYIGHSILYSRDFSSHLVSSVSVFSAYRSLPMLNFPELGDGVRILDSSNGLMLCKFGYYYAVCNPTTKKYKVLPELDHGSLRLTRHGCLNFDPSKSHHYKVISVLYYGSDCSYRIDIYSSENSSWKSVVLNTTHDGTCWDERIVFWDGAVHWMSRHNFHFRFDVDAEELTASQSVCLLENRNSILYFGECGGRLFLVHYTGSYGGDFTIREMESNNSSWTIRCNISGLSLAEILSSTRSFNILLTVVKGANNDDFSLAFATARNVILYNLKSKAIKVLGDSPFDYPRDSSAYMLDYPRYSIPYSFVYAHRFFESLSPL